MSAFSFIEFSNETINYIVSIWYVGRLELRMSQKLTVTNFLRDYYPWLQNHRVEVAVSNGFSKISVSEYLAPDNVQSEKRIKSWRISEVGKLGVEKKEKGNRVRDLEEGSGGRICEEEESSWRFSS